MLLGFTYSCGNEEKEMDRVALLSSTSWLGGTQVENFDYASDNTLISRGSYQTPDGLLNTMSLYKAKTARIKYGCDRTACNGDQYMGKWELVDNKLKVTINREELGSLVDASYMEGSVISLTASELIIEVVFFNPEPSVAKRVRHIKYIGIKQ